VDAEFAGEFEEVVGAADINVGIEERLSNGGTHTGAGGEVNDSVEAVALEERTERGKVADVGLDEAHTCGEGRDVSAFEGGVVEVVKVVEDGGRIAAGNELFGSV